MSETAKHPTWNATDDENNAVDIKTQKCPDFDPLKERKVTNPTSYTATLIHLLKASFAAGILGVPSAIAKIGYLGGSVMMLAVVFVTSHCAYILVQSAHFLYHQKRKTQLTYVEISDLALENSPSWLRKGMKTLLQTCLFLAYYTICSAYSIIVESNILKVLTLHKVVSDGEEAQLTAARVILAVLLAPMVLVSWVPNLKYLAPVSMLANLCMAVGLGSIVYGSVDQIRINREAKGSLMGHSWLELPSSVSAAIFAVEAIGVVMPLENNMENPRRFIGKFGVVNVGAVVILVVYTIFGFVGYMAFGEGIEFNITEELRDNEIVIQVSSIAIALALFCSFTLQMFVCLEIVWNVVKDGLWNKTLCNYACRTVLVITSVSIAIALPKSTPLINFVGAFCFSVLGIIAPAAIELACFWDSGVKSNTWLGIKCVFLGILGFAVLCSGSFYAILDIKNEMF